MTVLLQLAHGVKTAVTVMVGSLMSLLGMRSAVHPVVRLELLHMRNLQRRFVHLKLHSSCDKLPKLCVPVLRVIKPFGTHPGVSCMSVNEDKEYAEL